MSAPTTTVTGVSGFLKGRTLRFFGPLIAIGRQEGLAIRFDLDPTVSKSHARLVWDGAGWRLEDLRSLNGTYLNGERLPEGKARQLFAGDVVRCGFQSFRVEWTHDAAARDSALDDAVAEGLKQAQQGKRVSLEAIARRVIAFLKDLGAELPLTELLPRLDALLERPVEPGSAQLGTPPPKEPVLLGEAKPPAPGTPIPKPATAPAGPRAWRWVQPGEKVELEGRTITCGLFYFGVKMSSQSMHGTEPSLIGPVPDRLSESDRQHSFSYRQLKSKARLGHLDWLAAGRPAETMTDADLALFVMGLERRHFGDYGRVREDPQGSATELRRLLEGYGPDRALFVALSTLQMLFVPDAGQWVEATVGAEDIGALEDGKVPAQLAIRVNVAMTRRRPVNAATLFLRLLSARLFAGRLPLMRCTYEVFRVFEQLFNAQYEGKVVPQIARNGFHIDYVPTNPGFRSFVRVQMSVPGPKIHAKQRAAIEAKMEAAIEALEPYSRRLGSRPEQQGMLPAVALLPDATVSSHPTVVKLAETIAARGVELTCADLAPLWAEALPEALKGRDRELLDAAFFAAGYHMEPSRFLVQSLTASARLLTCRVCGPETPTTEFRAALPAAVLMASVLHAGERPSDETVSLAVARLGATFGVASEHAPRLHLVLEWLLLSGAKTSKRLAQEVGTDKVQSFLRDLAEVVSHDGPLRPAGVRAFTKVAVLLGVSEDEVYPLLHHAHTTPRAHRGRKSKPGHELDMQVVAAKIASSQEAAAVLTEVFVEETPEVAPVSTVENQPDETLRLLVRKLLTRSEWTSEEFAALAREVGLLPSAAYDAVNESALDRVGDPFLEGDDVVVVDAEVGREWLK